MFVPANYSSDLQLLLVCWSQIPKDFHVQHHELKLSVCTLTTSLLTDWKVQVYSDTKSLLLSKCLRTDLYHSQSLGAISEWGTLEKQTSDLNIGHQSAEKVFNFVFIFCNSYLQSLCAILWSWLVWGRIVVIIFVF